MPAKAKTRRRKARAKNDLTKIPCSTATNAFDLLEDVKKAIKADPNRYNQEMWICSTKPEIAKNPESTPAEYYAEMVKASHCGTVGCVAGWIWAMKAPLGDRTAPAEFAAKILGIHDGSRYDRDRGGIQGGRLANELFDGDAAGDRDEQTPEQHVEEGIAHITAFQKKYANRLKSTKVE